MQVKVKNAVLSYDYVKKVPQLVLELSGSYPSVESEMDGIKQGLEKGKEVTAEIKVHKPRRSLDSNAYCWLLIGKLSEKTGTPVTDIYQNVIREISGNREVVCVRENAVDRLRSGWSKNGIGWVSDTFPSKLEGCVNVILYYGSSTYDQAQMSRLIDLVVQDCRAVGIETMTPTELAQLKQGWSA